MCKSKKIFRKKDPGGYSLSPRVIDGRPNKNAKSNSGLQKYNQGQAVFRHVNVEMLHTMQLTRH